MSSSVCQLEPFTVFCQQQEAPELLDKGKAGPCLSFPKTNPAATLGHTGLGKEGGSEAC